MAETQYRTLESHERIEKRHLFYDRSMRAVSVPEFMVGRFVDELPSFRFLDIVLDQPYTVTELHTPQGSLDAFTKRCERAEKALRIAVMALRNIQSTYELTGNVADMESIGALAQIEALNTDTEK